MAQVRSCIRLRLIPVNPVCKTLFSSTGDCVASLFCPIRRCKFSARSDKGTMSSSFSSSLSSSFESGDDAVASLWTESRSRESSSRESIGEWSYAHDEEIATLIFVASYLRQSSKITFGPEADEYIDQLSKQRVSLLALLKRFPITSSSASGEMTLIKTVENLQDAHWKMKLAGNKCVVQGNNFSVSVVVDNFSMPIDSLVEEVNMWLDNDRQPSEPTWEKPNLVMAVRQLSNGKVFRFYARSVRTGEMNATERIPDFVPDIVPYLEHMQQTAERHSIWGLFKYDVIGGPNFEPIVVPVPPNLMDIKDIVHDSELDRLHDHEAVIINYRHNFASVDSVFREGELVYLSVVADITQRLVQHAGPKVLMVYWVDEDGGADEDYQSGVFVLMPDGRIVFYRMKMREAFDEDPRTEGVAMFFIPGHAMMLRWQKRGGYIEIFVFNPSGPSPSGGFDFDVEGMKFVHGLRTKQIDFGWQPLEGSLSNTCVANSIWAFFYSVINTNIDHDDLMFVIKQMAKETTLATGIAQSVAQLRGHVVNIDMFDRNTRHYNKV